MPELFLRDYKTKAMNRWLEVKLEGELTDLKLSLIWDEGSARGVGAPQQIFHPERPSQLVLCAQ